jgi:hypothetical protein
MILPLHSSHLTQPLGLTLFSPLQIAMLVGLSHIIYTGINRVTKAEWLCAYITAHTSTVSIRKIRSVWTAAGLFPFNPSKVLNRCAKPPATPVKIGPTTPDNAAPFNNTVLTSSPRDVITLYNANIALGSLLTGNQPTVTHSGKEISS